MATGLGSNSYLLMGEQTARGVRTPWGSFSNKVYQFTGGGLGLTTEYTNTPANKGNFGPVASIAGQLGSDGSIQMSHDTTGMGLWLKALMQSTPISTQAIATPYTLFTTAAFTSGTALTNSDFVGDRQPKVYIPQQPTATPAINCGKLIFSFATTVRGGDGANITIVGYDQGETRELTEVIDVEDTAVIADKTSANAFAEVKSVTFNSFGTAGDVGITVDPGVWKHVFEVGNTLTHGLTIEQLKDPIPNVYQDVHVSEGTLNVADVIEWDFTLIGGRAYLEQNAENLGSGPSSLVGKRRPLGITAPGWGTIFRLNNQRILCNGGSITVNHSLGATNYSYGKDPYRPPPIQTANREVTLSTEIGYPAEAIDGTRVNLVGYALGQDVSASFEANSMDYGALHNSVTLEMPTGRLTSFPDPASLDQGQIALPIEIAGYARGATTDFRLTVVNSETGTQFTD